MGICSFTQLLLIEHRLCVRTGAIKWVHNSENSNQQKSTYGSALVELLVWGGGVGRQILIASSLTPVRGPGALRGVWPRQESHKGLPGGSEVRALAACNSRKQCSHE